LVSSSVALVAYGVAAGDRVLGAVGLLAVISVFVMAFRVLDPRPSLFYAIAVEVPQTRVAVWWRQATIPINEWNPRHRTSLLFVEHYGYLFDGYRHRCHWWTLVDVTATVVLAVLSSIVSDTEVECRNIAWAVFAVVVCVLFGLFVVQPMNTTADNGVSLVLTTAQLVVVACEIGGVDDAAVIASLAVSITSVSLSLLPPMIRALGCVSAKREEGLKYVRIQDNSPVFVQHLTHSPTVHDAKGGKALPTSKRGSSQGVALRLLVELACSCSVAHS
jgi:hypothetical protein